MFSFILNLGLTARYASYILLYSCTVSVFCRSLIKVSYLILSYLKILNDSRTWQLVNVAWWLGMAMNFEGAPCTAHGPSTTLRMVQAMT